MEVAAKYTLQHPLEGQYVASEMEYFPAAAYHHLLVYHAACPAAAKEVLRDVLPVPASNSEADIHSDTSTVASWRQRARLAGLQEVEEIRMTGLRQERPGSPSRTTRDPWLESYVGSLIAKADTHCNYTAIAFYTALAEEVLWCNQRYCDFARKLSAADAAVRSMRGWVACAQVR